jgi:hypothetical protein
MGGAEDAPGAAGTNSGTSEGGGSQPNAGSPSDGGGGGSLPNDDALSLVSISPFDGETAVEREASVTINLSAPVDAKTITAKSFTITGPDGAVAGKFSVEGAAATFTPDAPWSLLADYTVELAPSIAGVDGSPLDEAHRHVFQTREGIFGKPERLTAVPVYLKRPVANRAGDVLVGWFEKGTAHQASAAVFDAAAAKWGAATLAASTPASELSFAISQGGAAVAFIGESSGTTIWQRWNGAGWSSEKSAPGMGTRHSLLADDGTATAMWETLVGNNLDGVLSAAALSAADEWGSTVTIGTKVRSKALAHFKLGYLSIFSRQSDNQAFYRVFDDGAWGAEKPLGSAIVPAHFALDTYDSTALFTWIDGASRMHASLFDGTTWTSQELGPADYGVSATAGANSQVAAWFYQGKAYAALHDRTSGWSDPALLGTGLNDSAGDVGPAAVVDTSANALVAWRSGTTIVWRRAPRSTEWSDLQEIKDQEPQYLYSTVDSSGNVMLVWSNPLGVWASRFE